MRRCGRARVNGMKNIANIAFFFAIGLLFGSLTWLAMLLTGH